jgi:hypothetical protein
MSEDERLAFLIIESRKRDEHKGISRLYKRLQMPLLHRASIFMIKIFINYR